MSALPSQRSTSFRFELLNSSLELQGSIDIDRTRPPKIDNNTNRTIKRQLSNVYISPSDASELNPLGDRVRVIMSIQGVGDFPLGVFVFSSLSREGTGRVWRQATLHDQLVLIDTQIPRAWGAAPTAPIEQAIRHRFIFHNIPVYDIADTGQTVGGTSYIVWKAGESGVNPVNDLCALGSCYSAYFDNTGTGIVRPVADIDAVEPTIRFETGVDIQSDQLMVTNDLLDAPNRYIVIDNSADMPRSGHWDVPASAPHSKENRGRVVAKSKDVQGTESADHCRKIAKAWGQSDSSTYQWYDFTCTPNPLLDTFDIAGLDGENIHIQAWSLTCDAGADMDIEARHIYRDLVA